MTFAANTRRDAETVALLEAQGWLVLRFWEHVPLDQCLDAVERAVLRRRGEELSGDVPSDPLVPVVGTRAAGRPAAFVPTTSTRGADAGDLHRR